VKKVHVLITSTLALISFCVVGCSDSIQNEASIVSSIAAVTQTPIAENTVACLFRKSIFAENVRHPTTRLVFRNSGSVLTEKEQKKNSVVVSSLDWGSQPGSPASVALGSLRFNLEETEFSASFPSSSDMFFSAHNGSSDAFSLSKNSEGIVVGLLLERGEPIPLECTSDSRVLSKWCGDFVEDAEEMAKESQKRGLAGFPSFLIELSGMPACSKVYQ